MKVYKLNEVSIDMEKNIAIVSENGFILQGKVYKVGSKEESRTNCELVNIALQYTCGNYILWTKKGNDLLKKAVETIEKLYCSPLSTRYKNQLEEELITILNITHHHNTSESNSKLDGINSLSSSCLDNAICLNRMNCGESVCMYCYSANQQKRQLSLQDRNVINGIILKNYLLPVNAWKKYFKRENLTKFFRIESFGDTENTTQGKNYLNFIRAFPRVHFSLFSKSLALWNAIFKTEDKPQNLSYVHSSLRMNESELMIVSRFWFIDHVFTVFDKKFIEKYDIKITCGGKACYKDCCRKGKGCFFPKADKHDNPIEQREQKK